MTFIYNDVAWSPARQLWSGPWHTNLPTLALQHVAFARNARIPRQTDIGSKNSKRGTRSVCSLYIPIRQDLRALRGRRQQATMLETSPRVVPSCNVGRAANKQSDLAHLIWSLLPVHLDKLSFRIWIELWSSVAWRRWVGHPNWILMALREFATLCDDDASGTRRRFEWGFTACCHLTEH